MSSNDKARRPKPSSTLASLCVGGSPFSLLLISLLLLRAAFYYRPTTTPSVSNFTQAMASLSNKASLWYRPASSRSVVMCAHDDQTLALAWTQIVALRALYNMSNERFTVFHAQELDENRQPWIKLLTTMPGVEVKVSLEEFVGRHT